MSEATVYSGVVLYELSERYGDTYEVSPLEGVSIKIKTPHYGGKPAPIDEINRRLEERLKLAFPTLFKGE